jgi:hypothetical protein
MTVHLDPIVTNTPDSAPTPSPAPSTPRVATRPAPPSPAPEAVGEAQKSAAAAAGILQAVVTFRRDPQGRIYYVVTDAQSGREIRELPPEEVRKVGEGIDEYLQREAAKTQQHLEIKA